MYNLNLKLNRLLPMEEQCREITNREFAAASANTAPRTEATTTAY
jgi:hypothetical protein